MSQLVTLGVPHKRNVIFDSDLGSWVILTKGDDVGLSILRHNILQLSPKSSITTPNAIINNGYEVHPAVWILKGTDHYRYRSA